MLGAGIHLSPPPPAGDHFPVITDTCSSFSPKITTIHSAKDPQPRPSHIFSLPLNTPPDAPKPKGAAKFQDEAIERLEDKLKNTDTAPLQKTFDSLLSDLTLQRSLGISPHNKATKKIINQIAPIYLAILEASNSVLGTQEPRKNRLRSTIKASESLEKILTAIRSFKSSQASTLHTPFDPQPPLNEISGPLRRTALIETQAYWEELEDLPPRPPESKRNEYSTWANSTHERAIQTLSPPAVLFEPDNANASLDILMRWTIYHLQQITTAEIKTACRARASLIEHIPSNLAKWCRKVSTKERKPMASAGPYDQIQADGSTKRVYPTTQSERFASLRSNTNLGIPLPTPPFCEIVPSPPLPPPSPESLVNLAHSPHTPKDISDAILDPNVSLPIIQHIAFPDPDVHSPLLRSRPQLKPKWTTTEANIRHFMSGATIPANEGRPSTAPDGSPIQAASFPDAMVQETMIIAQRSFDFLQGGRIDGISRQDVSNIKLNEPVDDDTWDAWIAGTPGAMRVDNFSLSFLRFCPLRFQTLFRSLIDLQLSSSIIADIFLTSHVLSISKDKIGDVRPIAYGHDVKLATTAVQARRFAESLERLGGHHPLQWAFRKERGAAAAAGLTIGASQQRHQMEEVSAQSDTDRRKGYNACTLALKSVCCDYLGLPPDWTNLSMFLHHNCLIRNDTEEFLGPPIHEEEGIQQGCARSCYEYTNCEQPVLDMLLASIPADQRSNVRAIANPLLPLPTDQYCHAWASAWERHSLLPPHQQSHHHNTPSPTSHERTSCTCNTCNHFNTTYPTATCRAIAQALATSPPNSPLTPPTPGQRAECGCGRCADAEPGVSVMGTSYVDDLRSIMGVEAVEMFLKITTGIQGLFGGATHDTKSSISTNDPEKISDDPKHPITWNGFCWSRKLNIAIPVASIGCHPVTQPINAYLLHVHGSLHGRLEAVESC